MIPLHEGFLCPRKKHSVEQTKLLMELLKDQINTLLTSYGSLGAV